MVAETKGGVVFESENVGIAKVFIAASSTVAVTTSFPKKAKVSVDDE